jgi:hypothetical protein
MSVEAKKGKYSPINNQLTKRYGRHTCLVLASCGTAYKRIGLLHEVMPCGIGEQVWDGKEEKQLVTIV